MPDPNTSAATIHTRRGMGAEDYCTCDGPWPCPKAEPTSAAHHSWCSDDSCHGCRPDSAVLEAARRAEGDAAVAYEYALEMRQAVDNNDRLAVAAWHTDVAAKATAWAHAQQVRRRLEAPTFEQLLTDPTQQFDRDSAVMRSIAEYQNATKGTMDAH